MFLAPPSHASSAPSESLCGSPTQLSKLMCSHRRGATITRLRAETGADIIVGKEDDLITIIGDAESVGFAKEAILSIATRSGTRF